MNVNVMCFILFFLLVFGTTLHYGYNVKCTILIITTREIVRQARKSHHNIMIFKKVEAADVHHD